MLFNPKRLFIDKVYIYECQVFNQRKMASDKGV